MRKTIAIAANELLTHRAYLGAAAVFGALALVAPYLPGFRGWDPAEVSLVAALFAGGLYCAVAALLLGGSMVVKELADGRLGFYLARPVSATSIWFGKVLGAYFTALGCELLVTAPALLLHSPLVAAHLNPQAWYTRAELVTLSWAVIVAVGFPLPFLLLAHVAALIWRGRTAWLVLDLVGLVSCGLLGWHAYAWLSPHLDEGQAARLLFWYAVAGLTAATIAGWRATSVGRADLRAAHRGLSLALWPLVALVAVGAWGFTRWETAVTSLDLAGVADLRGTAAGDWILVGGETARPLPLTARFLYRGATGEHLRLPLDVGRGDVQLSADGRAAIWLEPIDEERNQLVFADLAVTPPRVSRTSIFTGWCSDLVLSNGGDRIAINYQRSIAIYQTESGKLLRSVNLPHGCYLIGPQFESDTTIVGSIYGTMSIGEDGRSLPPALEDGTYCLHVDTGSLSRPESADLRHRIARDQIDRERHRALVQTYENGTSTREWLLVEWPSFRVVTRLPGSESWRDARLLSDGRIAYARTVGGRVALGLIDTQGQPITTFDLGQGSVVMIGGEPAAGFLAVGILLRHRPWETPRKIITTWAVDLECGDVREIGSGLLPISVDWALPPGSDIPSPGSLISRCFIRRRRELVRWDPSTHELTTVVPPDPHAAGPAGS